MPNPLAALVMAAGEHRASKDTVDVQAATVVVASPHVDSAVAVSVATTCSVPVYFMLVTVACVYAV